MMVYTEIVMLKFSMTISVLWNKQRTNFGQAALVQLLMEFAFVVAVGGVGFEDVAVA